ncbi:MAG: carbohydrate-binding family 9-like protein [Clostridiales bacterium]|nr:carbohydrate-binding family 9-like protein [Candidatus Coliplasma caballi]
MKPVYHVYTRSSVDFSGVPKAEISHYKWEEGYAPKAFAQLIYVEDLGFALHMEAEETDPKAVYTVYNQDVYKDSCMEFFVNFNPAQNKYINFEMNSNGAFLSALRADRHDKTPIHQLLADLPAVRAEKKADVWTVDAFFTLGQIETLFAKASSKKATNSAETSTNAATKRRSRTMECGRPLNWKSPIFISPRSSERS